MIYINGNTISTNILWENLDELFGQPNIFPPW